MSHSSPITNQATKLQPMGKNSFSIGLLADFNVQNLSVLLQKNVQHYPVNCVQGPFGQTLNVLLDSQSDFWSIHHHAVVLWTAPERAIPSFNKVLAFEKYDVEDLLKEVASFANLVERIPATISTIIIPSWVVPGMERGWGSLDLVNGIGVANALMRMNVALADCLGQDRRVILLDSQRWMSAAGAGAYNPKLWYLSKTPFHNIVLQEASKDILATVDGIRGYGKKIIILDLDNMLWGGVVGDIGWEKLRLGGHDPLGEAFADFQKGLKRTMNRGVVLAIVSKNEESTAMAAILQNPEMVLRKDDFVGWRINWNDKAQNIVDLMFELNLGLESAVFLDDSPFERARVREALPQVLVPDVPVDPMEYPVFLDRLRCFDNPFISAEDRNRTKMYVADRSRNEFKNEIASLDQWLAKLELGVIVEPLNDKNLDRATQLFNKTNQMNLSTRKLTAAELLSWAQRKENAMWTFRVRDKFGDYGLCGVGSLAHNSADGQIADFLISCRVMGRGVEEAMLATLTRHAKELGCDTVFADLVPTAKNQPCKKWFQSLPGVTIDGNRFLLKEAVPFPKHITINFSEDREKTLA
jgi:FkbH-like protein